MGKKLIIVESPAKAKTIGKILGPDFIVLPSVGHIRDLPERTLGIDTEDTFDLKYEISKGKTKVVADLRKAVKNADVIYLAPDPDREGEAIAWHLREVLSAQGKGKASVAEDKRFLRVRYNEITPRAVLGAVENPGEIDMNLVNAQQARRAVDRIVGYKISPILWRNIRGGQKGLSAGRVQTVALRLVCEREREITAFTPVAYWVMGAKLRKFTGDTTPFEVKLSRINGKKAEISSEEQAAKILADLNAGEMTVTAVKTKQITKRPLPPFITSSMQQAASSALGFSPSATMKIAQKLYEGVDLGSGAVGLITYMRTDAPAVSRDAQAAALSFIREKYGDAYCPPSPNVYRSKNDAQGAHESIHPTDITLTPEKLAGKLEPRELKLYDLIWRRFLASQMSPAKINLRTVEVESVPAIGVDRADSYVFTATASSTSFDGYNRVLKLDIRKSLAIAEGKNSDDDEDSDNVATLPDFSIPEKLDCLEWLSTRKETKPPTRFSEAALIKALEENGVGRPSTYASIIDTLVNHKYTTSDHKILTPTERGFKVLDFLVEHLPKLFEVGFTADMEKDLDKIEEEGADWHLQVKDFFGLVKRLCEGTKAPPAKPADVAAVLGKLAEIREWAPPVKSGRGVKDDAKFFNSVREQFDAGEKPISETQLTSLINLALRYEEQIPDIAATLGEMGYSARVAEWKERQTPPEAIEKINLLLTAELTERQRLFVSSLKQQIDSGRNLSEKQVAAIDKVLADCAGKLPGKEQALEKYGIQASPEALEEDTESPALIAALAKITEWQPPVKKNKREFDDAAFVRSVTSQFKAKGALSVKQRAAMRRIIARYKAQIPEADELLSKAAPKE